MNQGDTELGGTQKLEPIEHTHLADRVYETIREAILSGTLAPGERLTETRVAEETGASRSPVREALSRLKKDGLLDSKPRRGTYVSTLSRRDAWEVYTLRAALERLAFLLAPEEISQEDQEELQALVDRMEERIAADDLVGLSDLDMQVHESVIRLTNHRRLLSTWMSIISQIQLLSRNVIRTRYEDLSQVVERHQALLDALFEEDEERRVEVIDEHIMSVAERILSHFDDEES